MTLRKSNPSDHPRRTNWLDLLRSYLVPSISLLEHYPSAALEVWKVLSLFPIETRFQVYGEWKDVHYRRDPALAIRKAEAERDVKSLLRRLSTENVKKLGKTFARVAHTNPTVIFGIALNQVQSYDNLIIPVVEACRYLTDLGYDVMAYSILDALSSNRPKTKEDGTSIAMWLQGLATFTGHVYRRWVSMQPSLWIILQYLVNQLVSGNSKDLVVLRELISRMTAIEPFADLSDAQVASLAGGKYLRSEVFQKTEIAKMAMRGQQDGLAKAKARLASALLGKNLAIPLLVNIALQRQACLKTDAHLKSLGALFDQVCLLLPLTSCPGSEPQLTLLEITFRITRFCSNTRNSSSRSPTRIDSPSLCRPWRTCSSDTSSTLASLSTLLDRACEPHCANTTRRRQRRSRRLGRSRAFWPNSRGRRRRSGSRPPPQRRRMAPRRRRTSRWKRPSLRTRPEHRRPLPTTRPWSMPKTSSQLPATGILLRPKRRWKQPLAPRSR